MKGRSLMTKLRILMIAMVLGSAFLLGACVVEAPESDEVTESALESTDVSSSELTQSAEDEFETEAGCPLRWTCDLGGYYSTQSLCLAGCSGGPCYRDYDCSGACVCP
jgi:hypothetical protein